MRKPKDGHHMSDILGKPEPVGKELIDRLQKHPNRWHVRLIVASSAGSRVSHQECVVHAPDHFAAIAIVIATKFETTKAAATDDVHILCDPMPPELLTEEDIIARGEKRSKH